jgi:FMN reductase
MTNHRPLIVGMGGTTSTHSSSERALLAALAHAERQGAEVAAFVSDDLDFPNYGAGRLDARASRLVEAIRQCDGLIISTPAYHGIMSGMIKNALDCVEELRGDARPYLDGRAVGMIVCAYGDQAMGTTLTSLRAVVHALRGWPTPMGVAINSSVCRFEADGRCSDGDVTARLGVLAEQTLDFARFRHVA